MRNKTSVTNSGVAAGFDFRAETEQQEVNSEKNNPSASLQNTTNNVEIDPTRSYSPYYTPKPKKGVRGGTIGRGAVDKADRKVQFSLTCTQAQKKLFAEAAQKDKRKLPDFICVAIEEYIENHNLK